MVMVRDYPWEDGGQPLLSLPTQYLVVVVAVFLLLLMLFMHGRKEKLVSADIRTYFAILGEEGRLTIETGLVI
jgi:hypothetical protein